MGLITEFIVAKPEELPLVDTPELPPQRMVKLSVNSVLSLHLALIEEAFSGKGWEEALRDCQERPVHSASSEDGPWIFRVSSSLMKALLTQDVEFRRYAARRLAQQDEFQSWDGADNIFTFLDHLANLAHEAKSQDKQIFVWVSL